MTIIVSHLLARSLLNCVWIASIERSLKQADSRNGFCLKQQEKGGLKNEGKN